MDEQNEANVISGIRGHYGFTFFHAWFKTCPCAKLNPQNYELHHGENNGMKLHSVDKTLSEGWKYARKEEFISVFDRERAGLQRLALLLTANSKTAQQCFIRAFHECAESRSVVKEWVLSWARRVVIRNAISLVMGPTDGSFANTSDVGDDGIIAFPTDKSLGAVAPPEAILGLPAFERLVFVICVLERYSIYDCALLLGKSPRDIKGAQQWACNQVGQIDETGNNGQRFATP